MPSLRTCIASIAVLTLTFAPVALSFPASPAAGLDHLSRRLSSDVVPDSTRAMAAKKRAASRSKRAFAEMDAPVQKRATSRKAAAIAAAKKAAAVKAKQAAASALAAKKAAALVKAQGLALKQAAAAAAVRPAATTTSATAAAARPVKSALSKAAAAPSAAPAAASNGATTSGGTGSGSAAGIIAAQIAAFTAYTDTRCGTDLMCSNSPDVDAFSGPNMIYICDSGTRHCSVNCKAGFLGPDASTGQCVGSDPNCGTPPANGIFDANCNLECNANLGYINAVVNGAPACVNPVSDANNCGAAGFVCPQSYNGIGYPSCYESACTIKCVGNQGQRVTLQPSSPGVAGVFACF
ncbi:hypothetical protein RQP46_009058 [Phenoliferia psychrophenolica]